MGHFTHNLLKSCRLLLLLLGMQSDFLAELSRVRHVVVVAAAVLVARVLFRKGLLSYHSFVHREYLLATTYTERTMMLLIIMHYANCTDALSSPLSLTLPFLLFSVG